MSSVTCISFTLHSHGGSASFRVSCILALSILACMLFMLDLWRPSPANIIQKYVWVWDLARRGPFNIEAWVFTNMCSHILAQNLNSKSFGNEFANHPRQYFSYGYIHLTWVIVWPGPSMLGEKGFKKQIAPPTDRTSTLKGCGPRGPKVFISCTKNIVEAWPRYFLD